MGSRERRLELTPPIRIPPGLFGWLLLISLFLYGCQILQPITASQTSTFPSATLISNTMVVASATSIPQETATPTISPSPTISPTPGPPLDLSAIHSDVSYVSPITIQYVTKESVICFFELDRPTEGYLFFWSLGGGIQEKRWVGLRPDLRLHVIEISGLIPGEEYSFAVGVMDETGIYRPPRFLDSPWDPIQIRTLDHEIWPIRVGVLGDSGFGESITYELAERMAMYDLDFVLHVGDIVYSVSENNDVQEAFAIKYFQTLSPVLKRAPLYPVPGNHEYYEDAFFQDKPYYFHVFPSLDGFQVGDFGGLESRKWYAIELETIQILMLDSQLYWRGEGISDQTAWLMERLQDDRFQVTIPVFHVPPFSSGIYPSDGIWVQRDWVPLFENSVVPLVLSGHDHNYQRLNLNHITYIITGGGSSVLYPLGVPLSHNQFFAKQTHFVLLEIYADRMNLWAVTPKGDVLDQTIIEYSK
jgi:predicted phosphodiesterase